MHLIKIFYSVSKIYGVYMLHFILEPQLLETVYILLWRISLNKVLNTKQTSKIKVIVSTKHVVMFRTK